MKSKIIILFLSLLVITGCSSYSTYYDVYSEVNIKPIYDVPMELRSEEALDKALESYKKVLEGKKIFIDPGHGLNEENHTKDFEAEVNLRVAKFLKEFLEDSEAEVIMSRDNDEDIPLKERSELANESEADVFISIHHNAPGDEKDYWTNYTSTFYHSEKGKKDYNPYSHNLARYIQRDLAYAMRNSGGLGSFDGTYSDYVIYPGEGFSVLRETKIPAVLVECSFFSNPFEEERLKVEEFNKVEAWGIYKGLVKFFSNKFPMIKVVKEESELVDGDLKLTFDIESENEIDFSSVLIYFDDEIQNDFISEKEFNKLIFTKKDIEEGEHFIKVFIADKKGIYSKPFEKKIIIKYE